MKRKRKTILALLLSVLVVNSSCDNSETEESHSDQDVIDTTEIQAVVDTLSTNDSGELSQRNDLGVKAESLIPNGYKVFEEHYGDLNKDGIEDRVIVIKAINDANIVEDEMMGKVDRNRRGVMVFFNQDETWKLAVKNRSCFSSENEDGGVYFPPELSIEIDKGNLYFSYGHGRYGYWKYTFRYSSNKKDFELIGYDNTQTFGPIIEKEVSMNFLTGKKQIIENVNENTEESGDEVFEEHWEDIEVNKLILLSEVEDFDVLEIPQ